MGGSVAEAGGGVLETYVTGARSASPPPWLTFGGSGQNWDTADRSATGTLSNFTWGTGGAVAPAFGHADHPGTIGTGVLIRASTTGPPGTLSRLRGGPVSVCWSSQWVAPSQTADRWLQLRALPTS